MSCTVNTSVSGLLQNKRIELYTGTSNGSGVFSITFTTPFINPVVLPNMLGNDSQTTCRMVTCTTTGCTIQVESRASLTVLTVNLLSFAVTPTTGVSCYALVFEA